ncbi:MAG: winged helix-turn-helix domain-containing protein [Proteobacteria bacterium]|nr:winged helix-turn-helix domain-containing protein [Pseudomonadota bacterium]
MVNGTIWIAEDNLVMQSVYSDILGRLYNLRFIGSLFDFNNCLELEERPDLLILDLLFPEGRLHHRFTQYQSLLESVPFIVVSGLDEEDAVRLSINSGAVDFISKPFSKSEILVKIEKCFERQSENLNNDRALQLDPVTMSARNHFGSTSILTAKEFQILSLFIEAKSTIISRQKISDTLWKDTRVSYKTLDVHLTNIRRKIYSLGVALVQKNSGYGLELISNETLESTCDKELAGPVT